MGAMSEREAKFSRGAEHASALDRLIVLKAVGQRVRLLPSAGPGPLMEQDEDLDEAVVLVSPVLKPLRAAPMPVFARPTAAAISAETVVQRGSGAAANTVLVAVSVSAETICQQGVDLKAFTGKGEPRSVRLASKAVDDIHARMRELALASMKIGKNVLYLTVHARSLTNQHALRWRGYTVVGGKGGHKHLTWDEANKRIRSHPYGVLMQLQIWDAEARELNRVEQLTRAALRRSHAELSQDRQGAA